MKLALKELDIPNLENRPGFANFAILVWSSSFRIKFTESLLEQNCRTWGIVVAFTVAYKIATDFRAEVGKSGTHQLQV